MDWLKQTNNKPLFPDVIWARPETANGAGKLLIIGGSAGNFANIARAYSNAETARVGTIHLLVPEVLRKVTKQIPFMNYAPNNPSGSFARKALAEILDLASLVDAILIAGDLGKNSETSLLLEDILDKYQGWIIISKEGLESFVCSYQKLLHRPQTVICLDQNNLRDLAIEQKSEIAITSDISKSNMAKFLHQTSSKNPVSYTIFEQNDGSVWVSHKGNVAESTDADFNSAKSSVWLIQQPSKPFASLVSSMF